MILESGNAIKAGSAIAVAGTVSALPLDLTWILLILLGMSAGWLARVARMVQNDRKWPDIKKDILVSLLIGGANGLFAAILISYWTLTYIQGVGVAFIVAFAGLKTLDTVTRSLLKKIGEWGSSTEKQE